MSLSAPRRFLPSLPLLAAFEAAARTGSITEAAVELSLTQSAVSRQIRALEGQLGVELFRREKQKIRLTPGGETYAREIRYALTRISDASLQLLASPGGGTLTLAVPPTFGARWLIPRLAGFHAAHRDISINVLSRSGPFDFRQDVADAAIFFGQPQWGGAGMIRLMGERVIPACAPGLRAGYHFEKPEDLRRAPLLHLTSRPDAWEVWLREHEVDPRGVQGMLFDQFATLSEAAVAGFGLALLPEILIARELAEGRLVPALDLATPSAGAYHLAWPADRPDHPPLLRFRAWLNAEIAALADPLPG